MFLKNTLTEWPKYYCAWLKSLSGMPYFLKNVICNCICDQRYQLLIIRFVCLKQPVKKDILLGRGLNFLYFVFTPLNFSGNLAAFPFCLFFVCPGLNFC